MSNKSSLVMIFSLYSRLSKSLTSDQVDWKTSKSPSSFFLK